ncbi:MAG: DUF1090 family protein [Comamonadaceae bacterium]|nr:MAG: DUF1090 family protein [Comamonadaceae bacterium]
MRMTAGGLFAALAFVVTPAVAQSAGTAVPGDCAAQKVAIEQAMANAQSKGQMLQRRRLAETLVELDKRCDAKAPATSRAAELARLEDEARALQMALERVQARLRELRNQPP